MKMFEMSINFLSIGNVVFLEIILALMKILKVGPKHLLHFSAAPTPNYPSKSLSVFLLAFSFLPF